MPTAGDFELPNGLRFIVVEDRAVPAAAFGLCVRAGVGEEPPDRRGLAHFFEHMMFRGSERFGPREHSDRVARIGGNCNAGTSFDHTIYYENFPASGLESMFELEADRFQHLKVSPELADIERKVVLEELRMYENQPMGRAIRELMRALGGTHPYALDPLGREADLRNSTAADLEGFWRRLYRPRNTFAMVVGDVRREEVERLARRHFGDWRDPDPASAPDPAGRFELPAGRREFRLSVQVPLVARAHRLGRSEELDHPALDLLVALLAGGESAPIPETLVRKTRLCVAAGGQCLKLRRGGALAFFGAFLPPGRHAPRLRAIAEICERLAEKGPDPDDFARHLRKFRKRLAQAQYSAMERLMGLADAELLEGGYRQYLRALEDLAAVTPGRVRDLARRLFAPENTLELCISPERRSWWLPLAGLVLKALPR